MAGQNQVQLAAGAGDVPSLKNGIQYDKQVQDRGVRNA